MTSGTLNGSELIEMKEKILLILSQLISNGDISKSEVIKLFPGSKGRSAPDLPEFTFPTSKITVGVRVMGPFTLDAISRRVRNEIDPPRPPQTIVNYGTEDNPDWKTEENPADKEYKDALIKYEEEIGNTSARRMIDVIIENAVVVDYDEDEVRSTRELLISLGVDRSEVDAMSDHSIYVKHSCIKSTKDLTDLQNFVMGQSVPTEALVKAHEDSFRGDVQGEADR